MWSAQAGEAAGKAEAVALNAAQLSRSAHTKAALAAAISASQAYNQVHFVSHPHSIALTIEACASAAMHWKAGMCSGPRDGECCSLEAELGPRAYL